jgi:hypothetical protein
MTCIVLTVLHAHNCIYMHAPTNTHTHPPYTHSTHYAIIVHTLTKSDIHTYIHTYMIVQPPLFHIKERQISEVHL